jgi:hypothetical protein
VEQVGGGRRFSSRGIVILIKAQNPSRARSAISMSLSFGVCIQVVGSHRICCALRRQSVKSYNTVTVTADPHPNRSHKYQERRTSPPFSIFHPKRKSQTAQAPTICGPSRLFEMLMRDATPIKTMTRTIAPRTMGRVSIFASKVSS